MDNTWKKWGSWPPQDSWIRPSSTKTRDRNQHTRCFFQQALGNRSINKRHYWLALSGGNWTDSRDSRGFILQHSIQKPLWLYRGRFFDVFQALVIWFPSRWSHAGNPSRTWLDTSPNLRSPGRNASAKTDPEAEHWGEPASLNSHGWSC